MGCILLILKYIYETGLTGMQLTQNIMNIMESVLLLFTFLRVCKIALISELADV